MFQDSITACEWSMLRLGTTARRLGGRPRGSPALAARYSEAAASPPKYENVRKLIVGLGNPGDKYAKTRCVASDRLLCGAEMALTPGVGWITTVWSRHNIGSTAVAHFLETYVSRVLVRSATTGRRLRMPLSALTSCLTPPEQADEAGA